MDDDRTLLEKAAKAAGYPCFRHGDQGFEIKAEPMLTWRPWSPLTDDGDALRLAVKLQIDVKHHGDYVVAWFDGGFFGTGRIAYDGDPYAATRRAIVRAAAALTDAADAAGGGG
jgi:hypothetical protein